MMWSKHKLAHNQQREMGDNYLYSSKVACQFVTKRLHSEKLVSTTRKNNGLDVVCIVSGAFSVVSCKDFRKMLE